jgi:hypothetical protein
MGLDMYLTANRYLSQYLDEGNDKKIARNIASLPIGNNGMRVKGITCEAMYWRKANAIHKWFVDNCQKGVDDCNEYDVEIKQLKELRDICTSILLDHSKAPNILPACEGFFFGSTELDEYFWDEIKRTEAELSAILENPEIMRWNFQYRSSW